MKNITFSLSLSRERLVDYINRANIAYWGAKLHFNENTLVMTIVDDEEDGIEYKVGVADWERALRICATTFHQTFSDLMSDSGDMYTGDILIQLACFGEEKYA